MANGEYIHEIVFEGGETTTFSGDVFDSATGLDFLYKYVLILYRAEVLRIGPNTLPRAIAVDPDSRYIQILYIATCTSFLPS